MRTAQQPLPQTVPHTAPPSARVIDLPRPAAILIEGRVAAVRDDGTLELTDGRTARPALSCLIEPRAGDRVLYSDGAERFVLHLLAREEMESAALSVPGAQRLAIRQPHIDVAAEERLALRSLKDLEATAATGTLSLNARNLFATVSEALVENARHHIAHVGDYALKAKALLRIHGRQGLMTAEKDLKIDAERISMG